jgi:hypothetical protein
VPTTPALAVRKNWRRENSMFMVLSSNRSALWRAFSPHLPLFRGGLRIMALE